MEADPSWIADPNSLLRLRVPGTVASIGANGAAATASTTVATTNTVAQVPLTAVAHLVKRITPLVITHQGQFPAATISFNVKPGASLGEAVNAVTAAEAAIGLPETLSGSYAGDAAEFQRSLAAEPWLILAAVAVIYIVLGVLYESFIHPITILSTLPSAPASARCSPSCSPAPISPSSPSSASCCSWASSKRTASWSWISRSTPNAPAASRPRKPPSKPACSASAPS